MTKSTATTGRRRGDLSREVIIEAATAVAASGEPLTFRALGTALGADPTSVYRHFSGKEELFRCVFDQLMSGAASRVDRAATWRQQIRQLAEEAWRLSEEYPEIGRDGHMLATGGPGELACIELMLDQLRSSGLDDAAAVHYYSIIAGYVVSVSSTIGSRKLLEPDLDVDAPGSWLYDVTTVDQQRFPSISASSAELAKLDIRSISVAALEVFLDAAEAAARV